MSSLHAAYAPLVSQVRFSASPQLQLMTRLHTLNALCAAFRTSPADVFLVAFRGQEPPAAWLAPAQQHLLNARFYLVAEHLLNPVMLGPIMPAAHARDLQAAQQSLDILGGLLQSAPACSPLASSPSAASATRDANAFQLLGAVAVRLAICRIKRTIFEKLDTDVDELLATMLKPALLALGSINAQSAPADALPGRNLMLVFAINHLAAVARHVVAAGSNGGGSTTTVVKFLLPALAAPCLNAHEAHRLGVLEQLNTIVRLVVPAMTAHYSSTAHVLGVELVSTCLRMSLVGCIDAFLSQARKQLLSAMLSKCTAAAAAAAATEQQQQNQALLDPSLVTQLETVVAQVAHGEYCLAEGEEHEERQMLRKIDEAASAAAPQSQQAGGDGGSAPVNSVAQQCAWWAHALLSPAWIARGGAASTSTPCPCPSKFLWATFVEPEAQRRECTNKYVAEQQQQQNQQQGTAGAVSAVVSAFYTKHVYPRWSSVPNRPVQPFRTLREEFSAYLGPQTLPPPKPQSAAASLERVLVAGCGSGHQVAQLLLQYAGVHITCIDLCPANLAFAEVALKQLASEAGPSSTSSRRIADRVSLRCADILNFRLAPEEPKFDVIDCFGVLHHMGSDMSRGIAALADLLAPGGVMLLSVYGPKAAAVEAAKRWIASVESTPAASVGGDNDDDDDAAARRVRRLRGQMLSLPIGHPVRAAVESMSDFYSTSGFSDMLLHPEVKMSTFASLFKMVEESNRLKVVGVNFAADADVAARAMYTQLCSDKANPNQVEAAVWDTIAEKIGTSPMISVYVVKQ